MTWHCASCRTTVTWATPDVKPGMTKCPRCDKWMDRVEDAPTEGAA